MSSYQALDATKIVETLRVLEQRIIQRFPSADLAAVCRALIAIGERTHRNAEAIAAPNWPLRAVVYAAVAAGLAAIVDLAWRLDVRVGSAEVFGFFQGIDAAMHITVVVGAALLFATTADDRIKRRRALRELHVFRSIAHVIDMHQLTKDPGSLLGDDQPAGAAPKRTMTPSELTRYLDYCSEMLSLTSKLAALYAQVLPDAVVIDAVNEIENLTANFSRKNLAEDIDRRVVCRAGARRFGDVAMAADPLAIARDLVRCRSVTPAEGGALGLLEGLLKGAGFAVDRVTFREPGEDDVENLYARIGDRTPHLVFAGHTDVVPPGNEAAWTHPPFAADVADGTLYGRGAADMKGAIACKVAAVLDYVAACGGKPKGLKGSISFLITGDEEGIGVNGTVKLLQWASARGEKFDHCILGEPTNPQALGDMIKIGRRGSQNGTLIVVGTQGHVAYPALADNPVRGITILMSALMAEPFDQGNAHFDPSNLEFTSVDVGNKTVNVIPAEARARFNIRYNDGHTRESMRALIERRLATAAAGRVRWRVEWERANGDVFLTKPGPFVDLVADTIRAVTGRTPELSTSGGTSDARFIKDYCPVIEFGLANQTMHKVDERVPTADLVALTAIYRRILERYFAGGGA